MKQIKLITYGKSELVDKIEKNYINLEIVK